MLRYAYEVEKWERTYRRMLTYLTYADVCSRMLTYAYEVEKWERTYRRMLTYLTYADVC
jgi:hypothetical protein